jgi:hypothetical protein
MGVEADREASLALLTETGLAKIKSSGDNKPKESALAQSGG